jgi:hypothetical protein
MLELIVGVVAIVGLIGVWMMRIFRRADKVTASKLETQTRSERDTELELAIRYVASIPGTDRERRPVGQSKAALEEDAANVDDQHARMMALAAAAKGRAK